MKTVCTSPEIILGGSDVSHLFKSLSIAIGYGELNRVYLTLVYDPDLIEIHVDPRGVRYEKITVLGEDISDWVEAYSLVNDLKGRYIELTIHADREVLTINKTHPWENV